MSEHILKRIAYVLLGSSLLLLFVMPFFYPVNGHDAWIHLNWLDQFTALFRSGTLYPRWMPDSFSSFGSPAFYFYPPLSYWLASLLSFLVSDSSQSAYYLTIAVASILSGITMYALLRSMGQMKIVSFLGAALYLTVSYRFVNIFIRSALSEHLAFIFLPIILLGIEYSWKKRNANAVFWSGIGWGGLLLTNIPVAAMMVLVVPIYCAIRFGKRIINYSLFPFLGSLLGLCIAALYMLPALYLRDTVRMNHLWDLFHNPQYLENIIQSISIDRDVLFKVSNTMLLLVSCVIGFIALFRRKYSSYPQSTFALAIILLLCFCFQFSFTDYLWKNTLLQYIQLPWRLSAIITLALPIITVGFLREQRTLSHLVVCVITILSLSTAILSFTSFHSMNAPDYMKERNDPPEYASLFADNSPQQVQDFLASMKEEEFAFTLSSDSNFQSLNVAPSRYSISYSSADTAETIFHLQYFPLWQLFDSDGREVMLQPSAHGLLSASLPAGEHHLTLLLRTSSQEKTGEIISGLGLLTTAILGFFAFKKRRRS